MTALAVAAAVGAGALALPSPAAGQERGWPTQRSAADAGFEELDRDTLDAIERGVGWLAREQLSTSGRWPSTPQRYQMSVTALAGLALLAHGDTPDSGKYSRQVRRAVEWILESQRRTERGHRWHGLLFEGNDDPFEEGVEKPMPMHGHGFALLFLAEAYGQTREPALRERMHEAITAAARLTERSITPDGGWFYTPDSPRDEGSVTITQIQGLRSARNAGISVDASVIDRAVNYIKASQDPKDGGVRYALRWGKTSPALTAAGVSVLHAAGEYHGEALEKGYAYLRQHLTTDPNKHPFYFYTHLYAVQAMFQRGGPEWAHYFPEVRRELLAQRRGYPYWDSHYGKSYGTAIALLILQVPLRYLPIFQR
ncbi:MAG: terpene cyclase/mutase family protein [Planctomycetes bacterium]|nr:terpene cyclase/mutase family protein [Planctomycetota bacterium]